MVQVKPKVCLIIFAFALMEQDGSYTALEVDDNPSAGTSIHNRQRPSTIGSARCVDMVSVLYACPSLSEDWSERTSARNAHTCRPYQLACRMFMTLKNAMYHARRSCCNPKNGVKTSLGSYSRPSASTTSLCSASRNRLRGANGRQL